MISAFSIVELDFLFVCGRMDILRAYQQWDSTVQLLQDDLNYGTYAYRAAWAAEHENTPTAVFLDVV